MISYYKLQLITFKTWYTEIGGWCTRKICRGSCILKRHKLIKYSYLGWKNALRVGKHIVLTCQKLTAQQGEADVSNCIADAWSSRFPVVDMYGQNYIRGHRLHIHIRDSQKTTQENGAALCDFKGNFCFNLVADRDWKRSVADGFTSDCFPQAQFVRALRGWSFFLLGVIWW